MKLKRIVLIVAAVFVLLLVAVPFLIPTGSYINQIEQMAAKKLGEPVAIKSLHVALLPSPRVKLGGIVVGKDAEIQVVNVLAVLDMATLFDAVRVVSRLEVEQPVVKKAALEIFSRLAAQQPATGEVAPVALRSIVLRGARLEWDGMNLPSLDADIAMSDAGILQQAALASSDGKLTVKAAPKGDGYAAHVEAKQWTLPAGPAVVFDTLSADLEYHSQTLDVPHIEAGLYSGKLSASAKLDWQKNWLLSGKFKSEAIELGAASKLFTRAVRVSGRISGNGDFASRAKEPGLLADHLVLDYRFSVANGVLYGVDLVKAASLLVRQGQTGGETQFNELSGQLHTSGKQIELSQMRIASGLLAAQGNLKITPDRKLSGKMDAELKKGVALVTVPLEISGTLDQPSVMPTKAAMAGAVAGTMLLGPGLGTSLGMKAGSAMGKAKNLFGGGK